MEAAPDSQPTPATGTTVGRWRTISRVVRALAGTAGTDDAAAFTRLILGLTAPVRQLDELAALAGRAHDGDAHARCDLRATIGALSAAGPPACEPLGDRLVARHESDCDCGCADEAGAGAPPAENADSGIIDQQSLGALVVAVHALYEPSEADAARGAVDVVVTLATAAGMLTGLSTSLARGGPDALVDRLTHLGDVGRLAWAAVPVPMYARSGGMPGGFTPPGPVPGVPGGPIPGVPGGFNPRDPDVPHGLDDLIDALLAKLRKKPRWDPEIWDHNYPWWRDPILYFDPYELEHFRCFVELLQLLRERAMDVMPPHLGRVVWNDGISGITQRGGCAGDKVTITGVGFGDTQPADVVVLVPTIKGCRPVAVDSWSDTEITISLPAGVSSGAIGFGDGDYITRYDEWAARQDGYDDAIRGLWCGSSSKLPPHPRFDRCPPDSPLTRLSAGSAAIHAFTANFLTVAGVQPTDPITLRWTVENATQIRIERTSASGPTFGGSTSLVNPAGTSYALPAANNGGLQVYTYRLTATGPCGAATHDVTIAAVKRPGLWIAATEVTQSIQTTTSSVRLVERKPTVVRVTVRHGLNGWGPNSVAGVRGRIRVLRGGSTSPWYDAANDSSPMAATPGASITVPANPSRNNTNDTLNFLIPPAWATGTGVRFEVEVRMQGFGATGAFTGIDELVGQTFGRFTFEARRTLDLRYIRVNWGGTTPTHQTCLDTLRGAVPLLPTPTANISALAGVGVQNPAGTGDADRDGLLDRFDDQHNCSVWEFLTQWLGSDCPDDDGSIWVIFPGVFYRGRAKGIPSNVCFTPPSDGPYAAHELSHCLNQVHVGLMCSNGQQAQGGDPASAWPNNAQLADVPFDVTRNVALTLAGTGVFDVMTYCGSPNNTWPMPARWQRLWDRIGS